jgi:hypothetical protein
MSSEQGFGLMTQIEGIYKVNKEVIEMLDSKKNHTTIGKIKASYSSNKSLDVVFTEMAFSHVCYRIKGGLKIEELQLSEKKETFIEFYEDLKPENERQFEMAKKYDKVAEIREKNLRITMKNLQDISVCLGNFHSLLIGSRKEKENEVMNTFGKIEVLIKELEKNLGIVIELK